MHPNAFSAAYYPHLVLKPDKSYTNGQTRATKEKIKIRQKDAVMNISDCEV